MHRLGLRRRFILLIVGLFLVLFATVSYILVRQYTRTFHANLNEEAQSFATLATTPLGNTFVLYKDSGSLRIEQQMRKYLDLSPDIVGITIFDTNGKQLFSSGNEAGGVTAEDAATFDIKTSYRPDGTVQRIVAPLIEDFGAHRYTLVYSVSNQRITQSVNHIVGVIILASAVLFVVVIGVTYLVMARLFIQPISQISEAARIISNGNFDRQIKLSRKDELGDLAVAVNTMADSLKDNIAKLQETDRLKSEFMTITSHNLRTPLTVINGYMDELQHEQLPPKLKPMLEAITANVLRLDNFTDDVLTIAMMESGESTMYDMASVALKPYLDGIASSFAPIAREKKQSFTSQIDLGEQHALISPPRLKNALWNLLDNAQKFTAAGGSISLNAHVETNRVVITIADSGIGISKEELPKLFTKFHRATGILNYDYEGTGIGLYITKLIIEGHHGSIAVSSQEGKGTTMTIWLPIA